MLLTSNTKSKISRWNRVWHAPFLLAGWALMVRGGILKKNKLIWLVKDGQKSIWSEKKGSDNEHSLTRPQLEYYDRLDSVTCCAECTEYFSPFYLFLFCLHCLYLLYEVNLWDTVYWTLLTDRPHTPHTHTQTHAGSQMLTVLYFIVYVETVGPSQ